MISRIEISGETHVGSLGLDVSYRFKPGTWPSRFDPGDPDLMNIEGMTRGEMVLGEEAISEILKNEKLYQNIFDAVKTDALFFLESEEND